MAKIRFVICKLWKDETEFAWRNKLLGLRQKACRECRAMENAAWYQRHHDTHRENVRQRKARDRETAQRLLYEYLSNRICADCGEYDFSVLTFDHVWGRRKRTSPGWWRMGIQ